MPFDTRTMHPFLVNPYAPTDWLDACPVRGNTLAADDKPCQLGGWVIELVIGWRCRLSIFYSLFGAEDWFL